MSKSLTATTLTHARKDSAFAKAFRSALIRVAAVRMDPERFWGVVGKMGWPDDQDVAGSLFEEVESDQELLAFLRSFQEVAEGLLKAVQENVSKTPMGEIEGQIGLTSFGMAEAAAIVAMGKATCMKCMESVTAVTSVMESEDFDADFLDTFQTTATVAQYLEYREAYNTVSEQARALVEVFKSARGSFRSQLNEAQTLLERSGGSLQNYLSALESQNTGKIEDMRESDEVSQALVDFGLAIDMLTNVAGSLQSLQSPLNRQISEMI